MQPQSKTSAQIWSDDGPSLPLEFSRISRSRRGALTLVIDPQNGTPTQTSFTFSDRQRPEDVIYDLSLRERTSTNSIGFYIKDQRRIKIQSRSSIVTEIIFNWANQHDLDAVIWSDRPSNFEKKLGRRFSVDYAIDYLKAFPESRLLHAIRYMAHVPERVDTVLRRRLRWEPWWQHAVARYQTL
ncbi:MAG: hypothetical protein OHK0022_28810 [Roseiflexaceae bacterium]